MNLIEREFCDTLTLLSDFEKCRYLVAFSGGVDSLALLALTVSAVGKENVVPVYVNHNLRTDSELEEENKLNTLNCETLGLGLKVRNIEKNLIKENSKNVGIEASARKIRYAILEEERIYNSCDYILTAHHRDDQIETVLMKIISNGPVSSLRGIAERRNKTLRPLLEFSKQQLSGYADSLGLKHSEDSTNSDNSIKRNEIRNVILPELKKIMPDCDERILNIRNRAYDQCLGVGCYRDCIPLKEFQALNDAKKVMALYDMWDHVMGTVMPQTLAKRVLDIASDNTAKSASSNGGEFYTYNGMIFLVNLKESADYQDFSIDFDVDIPNYNLPYNLVLERRKEGLSTDISINPLLFNGQPVIRFARNGEVINLKDGRKTVNKLLQDMKVPSVFRSRVPVIADDDGLCVVFGSVFGGRDRICVKMRSALALDNYYKYICYKGNYAYE